MQTYHIHIHISIAKPYQGTNEIVYPIIQPHQWHYRIHNQNSTKAQRPKDSKVQRYKGTKVQRQNGSKVQRHKGTKHKDTKV
jgi:hypothetical protein